MSCVRFKNICSGGCGARTAQVRAGDLSGASINPAWREAGWRRREGRADRQHIWCFFWRTLHFNLRAASTSAWPHPSTHHAQRSGSFVQGLSGWGRRETGLLIDRWPGSWSNWSQVEAQCAQWTWNLVHLLHCYFLKNLVTLNSKKKTINKSMTWC